MIYSILRNIVIVTFCLIITIIPAFSIEDKVHEFPRTYLEFSIFESEMVIGKYLNSSKFDSLFEKYDYKEIPYKRTKKDRMLTLKSNVFIDSLYVGQHLFAVVMPVNYPCNIYLNEELIYKQGNIENIYTSRIHYSEKVFLPQCLIHYNENNQIVFQLYPLEGETHPLNKPFISNSKDAANYVFYRNFLGPNFIHASSFCGIIFFIFFLFTYLSRREYNKPQFLYFALMNLFLTFSFINNILSYNFSNTYLLELISRISFQLSMVVGLLFLFEYTNVFRKKNIFKIGVVVAYVPMIVFLFMQENLDDLMHANNTLPLIMLILGNLFFVIIAILYFLKEKSPKSFFLLIIYLFNLFSGFHDSYYFAVLKMKPYLLLIPNSVFLMNLTIFFILAIDHSKLYHLALSSSEKLEVLNQELELMVETRTQKVTEYAHKLEEANNTKDKFFSIIAHDMKNPFNTLIGYSDILKTDFREYSQDEIQQQLNIIYDTSVKGFNLLENLLKWSQSQTKRIHFEPVKTNLHELVKYCIEDIHHQSSFKDILLENNIPKNFHIIADQNLLKIVIRNLVSNALKYTESNGVILINSKKEKDSYEVSVEDNGVGMSSMELQSIFKIDKVFSKPRILKEKGSGLGLILCKEFIEMHGGKIWVESETGIGSKFKFTIPKIIV